ncbi:hypothetical protein PPTG_04512 [Phytophthora nicotianae INRA-310]|uniref:ZSWIM1/3 RNaseH-like domain-containing protein n=1 Tax=Phytophthora nicotianae (strain INRA-310) TaxID=761204 RepID=W2R3L7_PHYN3|nr:hypothetical protein PPTG_04512 [Phytophthora nicotianae INRA-310]ETN19105.1 hypothetical protein PPTG_04512 [Phytophthora nicotianae INRA-310]
MAEKALREEEARAAAEAPDQAVAEETLHRKRTSHNLRRTECPFQFQAQVNHLDDGSWGIVLESEVFCHNHQVSPEIYQHYPGIRQVSTQSPLVPGVELLMDSQARTSSIYEYIRDNSEHRDTMTDVRNMVDRLRSSVAETIVNFNMESPQNVSSVYQSARGNTGVISITTGHMRSMLGSFPEILQMDCTHKTNKHNYRLLSIVAMDRFGNGQPVQYSFVRDTWRLANGKEPSPFQASK